MRWIASAVSIRRHIDQLPSWEIAHQSGLPQIWHGSRLVTVRQVDKEKTPVSCRLGGPLPSLPERPPSVRRGPRYIKTSPLSIPDSAL